MLLYVGKVTKPHGIRGEVIVDVRTDEPEARFLPGTVFTTEPGRAAPTDPDAVPVPEQLTIESVRSHQGKLIVAFDGVYDRNVAEVLRNVMLVVDSADVPDPDDPDEFNDHQLIGLAVVTVDGEPIGEVARIDHSLATDMLVVKRPAATPALIPFLKVMVPEIDLAGRRVVIDPPNGLLDL